MPAAGLSVATTLYSAELVVIFARGELPLAVTWRCRGEESAEPSIFSKEIERSDMSCTCQNAAC